MFSRRNRDDYTNGLCVNAQIYTAGVHWDLNTRAANPTNAEAVAKKPGSIPPFDTAAQQLVEFGLS